jgi:hypothetical protein
MCWDAYGVLRKKKLNVLWDVSVCIVMAYLDVLHEVFR